MSNTSKVIKNIKNNKIVSGGTRPDISKLILKNKKYNTLYIDILNWLSCTYDDDFFKKETLQYLFYINHEHINILEKIESYNFVTIGKIAWLLNRNCELTEETLKYFNNKLLCLYNKYKEITSSYVNYDGIDYDIEEYILTCVFDKTTPEYSKYLNKFKNTNLSIKLNNIKNELLHIQDDEQIKEAYNYLDDGQVTLYMEYIDNCINYLNDTKSAIVKSVSKLKFKMQDDSYGIKSLLPKTIEKTYGVILMNIKNKNICLLYANNGGFNIRGTKITNINNKLSMCAFVKNPKDILENIDTKSIRLVNKVLTQHKSKKIFNKFNNNIVIIKCYNEEEVNHS